jgi:acetoin utilization protein AcuB
MRTHGFRRLPVVDEDDRLVGIVCEHDLMTASPSRPGSLSVWELNRLQSTVKIREIMTEDVVTTTPDTPIEDVARLMTDEKIGGMPVVAEHDRVIGVITETDVFKAFVEMFAGGYPGLRLTLEVPEGKEILLELGEAISESGGQIVSVGSFYGDAPGKRRLVIKVLGTGKGELEEALEALGDHVVDAREV